jgi:hypothetical protein
MSDLKPKTNWEIILGKVQRVIYLVIGLGLTYLGEHGQDGGFIQDIWAQAKIASPLAAMLLLVLYFDEKRERRDAQRQCNDRTIEFIQSNNVAHAAMEKMSQAHKAGMERIAVAYDKLVAQYSALVAKRRGR